MKPLTFLHFLAMSVAYTAFSFTRPLIIATKYIIIQTKKKVNAESIKTLKVYYFKRKITMKKAIGILVPAMMILTFTTCGQTGILS